MFYSFYVCMVVRKFFFYLDPLRTGKIRIVDILSCGFLDELLEVKSKQISMHYAYVNLLNPKIVHNCNNFS